MLSLDTQKEARKFSRLQTYTFIIVILISGIFIIYSSPFTVVVNKDCEIEGVINNIRAYVQKEKFWMNQLDKINSSISSLEEFPLSLRELDKKFKEIDQMLEEKDKKRKSEIEQYYIKYPEERPLISQMTAEKLRNESEKLKERAEEIEWEETLKFLEKENFQKIRNLEELKTIVEKKLSSIKKNRQN